MRRFKLAVACVLLVCMMVQVAHGAGVMLGDRPLDLPPDQQPQIIAGRTVIPMRAIFEALGASIAWDSASRTVTATRGDAVVQLTIGAAQGHVDGRAVALDQPAQIIDGRTYVPLRFVAEALGADVVWQPETRVVAITLAGLAFDSDVNTDTDLDLPDFDDPGPDGPEPDWPPPVSPPPSAPPPAPAAGAGPVDIAAFLPDDWYELPLPRPRATPAVAPVWGDPVSILVPDRELALIPGEPLLLRLEGFDEDGRLVAVRPEDVALLSAEWTVDPATGDWVYHLDERGLLPPLTIGWGAGRTQTFALAWLDPGPAVDALLAEMQEANAEFMAVMAEAMAAQESLIPHEEFMLQYAPVQRAELDANRARRREIDRAAEENERRRREIEAEWAALEKCKDLYDRLRDLLAHLQELLADYADLADELADLEATAAAAQAKLDAADAALTQAIIDRQRAQDAYMDVVIQRDALVQWIVDRVDGAEIAPPGTLANHLEPAGTRDTYAPTPPGTAVNYADDSVARRLQGWFQRRRDEVIALRELEERLQKELADAQAAEDAAWADWLDVKAELDAAQADVQAKQQQVQTQAFLIEMQLRLIESLLAQLAANDCPIPAIAGLIGGARAAIADRDGAKARDLSATDTGAAVDGAADAVADQQADLEQEYEDLTAESAYHDREKQRLQAEEDWLLEEIRRREEQAAHEAEQRARAEEQKRIEEAERAREAAALQAARMLERHKRLLERKMQAIVELQKLQAAQDPGLAAMLQKLEDDLAAINENGLISQLPDEIVQKLEDLQGRLNLIRSIVSLLERAGNPNLSAAERAQAMKDVLDLAATLGEGIPGLGAFLSWYSQALAAIVVALGQLEQRLGEATVRALDCETYLRLYPGHNDELARSCRMRILLQQIRDP